jgi:hypothetical protein
LLPLKIIILLDISKYFYKEKIYGIPFFLFYSIIMEFLDDGDLYQKIVEHKKKGQLF